MTVDVASVVPNATRATLALDDTLTTNCGSDAASARIEKHTAELAVELDIACTDDVMLCPDGTAVGRFPPTCQFAPCPVPDLHHFQCYAVRRQPFDRVDGVSLVDQFGASTASVRRISRLCNPARKETATDSGDPSAVGDPEHLMAFKIRQHEPRFTRLRDVEVTNQFGTIMVDVIRPVALLVPTAKDTSGPVPPLVNPDVNHFKCYKVKRVRQRVEDLKVEDQFGVLTTVDLKRPTMLCNPVNKRDEDPTAVDDPNHLLCYQVRTRPRFAAFEGLIWFANQFLGGVIDAEQREGTKPTELCVPSTKQLP